nr:uncharacterized protein LOC105318185 [Crassostrea gigas]
MVVREVFPEKYDELDQKLERELPLSIFGLVHFRLMRRKHILKKKMVLVDSWPDFSVLLIVDRQRSETWLVSVCFCKGPGFASNIEIILEFVSEISPPQYIVGCTSDVMDALISAHQSLVAPFDESTLMPLFIQCLLKILFLYQFQTDSIYLN